MSGFPRTSQGESRIPQLPGHCWGSSIMAPCSIQEASTPNLETWKWPHNLPCVGTLAPRLWGPTVESVARDGARPKPGGDFRKSLTTWHSAFSLLSSQGINCSPSHRPTMDVASSAWGSSEERGLEMLPGIIANADRAVASPCRTLGTPSPGSSCPGVHNTLSTHGYQRSVYCARLWRASWGCGEDDMVPASDFTLLGKNTHT